ncbi:efflux RND transporter permease subunit [Nitrospira sp. Nam74]
MGFSALCIRRPVFATVITLILVLVGLLSFARLPVREYPDIDFPIVSVTTEYPGASSALVETDVTRVLEGSLAGIEGLRTLTSSSREEQSQITIEFDLNRDLDAAVNDVRDRVLGPRRWLPPTIQEPMIFKARTDSQPIIWLSLFSERHSDLEMTDFAERYLKDRLATIPGVSAVWIWGSRRYAIRIWLDADRLGARELTVQDVEEAIRTENVAIPSGRIQGEGLEFSVRTRGELATQEHFNRLIITYRDGYPVRIEDVGHAEIGAEDDRRLVRANGESTVSLGVVKQSKANALAVARAVHGKFSELQGALPAGMRLQLTSDRSRHIEQSLQEVYLTMGVSIVLVVLVIFLFLGNLHATIIPAVAIPASILSTFTLMYAAGFSINLLTLLGLVLAVGLVVDDAIIVLENIYRRVEQGQSAMAGAMDGTREIGFAVIATTISLVTVFVPIAFLTDATARLFTELALAVAGSVLISGVIALTLTPMMSAKLLADRTPHKRTAGRIVLLSQRSFDRVAQYYILALGTVLRWRMAIPLISIGMVALGIGLFIRLPSELAPLEDTGAMGVTIQGPEGTTLAYTDRYVREVEALYHDIPEIESYFSWVGSGWPISRVNAGGSWVTLKDWNLRRRSQQEIVSLLAEKMAEIPGVRATPFNPPALIAGGSTAPVQFVISASTYEDVEKYLAMVMESVTKNRQLLNVTSNLDLNKPQLDVHVNREKAGDLGVSVGSVGHTLESLLGGRQVTRFSRDGIEYPVIVKVSNRHRGTPSDINMLHVRGHSGQLVQLSNLVTINPTTVPTVLNHYDKMRSAIISAGLATGYALGDALDFLEQTARDKLPSTATINYSGESKAYKEANQGLWVIFVFSVLLIYLVLAAQFESFVHPLTILFSVLPALTGALTALTMFGGTLNVYSEIGFIMLVGLVSKNAILIVDFANQLQAQGEDLFTAIVNASSRRLRPILMTSLATILGALPLALMSGAGAIGRGQLGYVIIAGMTFSTVLTLLMVPATYYAIACLARSSVKQTVAAMN